MSMKNPYYSGLFLFSVTGEISGGFGRADSDEDDGPVIPDLDDVQDEDMALQVNKLFLNFSFSRQQVGNTFVTFQLIVLLFHLVSFLVN